MNDTLEIWSKAHIPFAEKRNIIRKLVALLNDYRTICRNIQRQGPAQINRESAFKD